ncbi:MAG: thermosome subunit alpha [Candidatus Altarchaeaceae archaeon]
MAEKIQPILLLPEGALRTTGRDAQKANIAAAIAVGEIVRTTLGPKGMDKMLVDDLGDITITNDGATIVSELKVDHPAAKMMVEVAKTQDKEVGDGTTTVTVLASAFLEKADKLIDKGIHPTVVIRGFRIAAKEAQRILNEIADNITEKDRENLRNIAITAMTGKGSEAAKTNLADMCVDAVLKVAEKEKEKVKVNLDDIQVIKKTGKSMADSELIEGIIIEKEALSVEMPKVIRDAKIALLDVSLEIKKTETDAKISITNPEQMQAFLAQEEKMLKDMAEKIIQTGANVVFCQKGIDDIVQYYLAKANILAARRVKKSDMDKLAKATGARIVNSIKDLSKNDLGYSGVVEQVKIYGDEMIFVKECKNPKAVSLLLRGGTEHVVDELERAVTDALGGIKSALENGKYVAGGGATEIELAIRLENFAKTVGGKEQLAISAFASAFDIIPKTLAESAGMDPIDTLVKLKEIHANREDGKYYGVNVIDKEIRNMKELNVIEPLKIKTQAIKSASEAAEMILRIDDVVAASKSSTPSMPSSMPPESMGGES